MTLDEARGCPELALWCGSREEFLLNPESGVVMWRPAGSSVAVHGDSWHAVPPGKVVPEDGWSHRFDCDCAYCR